MNVALVEKNIEEIQISNDSLLEKIKILEVNNDETLATAADYLKKIKDAAKQIDEKEKEFTRPLNDTLKKIRDVFRPQKAALDEMKVILEQEKILPYQREVERQRREEEERKRQEEAERLKKLQEEKEAQAEKERGFASEKALNQAIKIEEKRERVESRPIKVSTQIKTKTTHMNIRKNWTYEITDERLVPREYCEPSKFIINSAVQNGVRDIPGVRIFEKEAVVSR